MKKQHRTTTHCPRAASGFTALLAGCLVLTSSVAKADTVIYEENFDNPIYDSQPVTTVPGWYNVGSTPQIVGGKITTLGGGYNDTYVDLGGDIFSHGSDHVKISWDSSLGLSGEYNMLFGSGTAATQNLSFSSQIMGFQRGYYGSHYFYAFIPNTYFDYADVRNLADLDLPVTTHFVLDATKSGSTVTWGIFYQPTNISGSYPNDGLPLWTGSSGNARSADVTDSRGINTLNFFDNESGHTVDNVKVVAIVPQPASSYAINYNGTYQDGEHSVTGTLGPAAANQANWNNIHSGQSVNGGGGGNFDSTITDSNGANPITLHTTFGNADGGNDGGGDFSSDFARLYSTGLRLGDVWCRATTDVAPFPGTYDVYIYKVGSNFNVNGTSIAGGTGPVGSNFVLGANYVKVTGLSGPLDLYAYDAINGFSLVNTSVAPQPQADIITFGLPSNAATITGTNIALTVPFGTDPSSLAPTFTMSDGATCDRTSGTAYNFSSPVHYIVTSSDTLITKDYTVTVTVTPASSAKDILTFALGMNTGTITGTNIALTVPYGTSLSSLAPTYTTSALATGSPLSGTSHDFSGPVNYTITAQDTTTKVYTVTITAQAAPSTSYAVNYNGTYNDGTHDVTGTLGPEAANQGNWNNIHSGQSVNGGGGGNFDSVITDGSGINGITLHTTFGNADGGNDGGGSYSSDFATLYSTGLRLGDVWCRATTDVAPFAGTYDVYIYNVGKNFNVNGTSISGGTGPLGTDFVLGQNYVKVTGLSGPLDLYAYDSINGFSIVSTAIPPEPYALWAAAKGLTGGGGSSTDPAKTADPEKDGVVNALEFYLDGNPLSGDAPNMAGEVSGGNLVLTYKRRDDAESLNIVPQSSTGLSGWATLIDGVGGVSITALENGLAPDDVTITIPIGAEPRNFARLLFTP